MEVYSENWAGLDFELQIWMIEDFIKALGEKSGDQMQYICSFSILYCAGGIRSRYGRMKL